MISLAKPIPTSICSCCLALVIVACQAVGQSKPETRKAFDRYVQITEQRIGREEASASLFVDSLAPAARSNAAGRLSKGEVVVESRLTRDEGQSIDVPGGMVHHWVGVVFVPGVTIPEALALLQDYDDHYRIYAPEVERSKVIARTADDFQIYYRLRREKVVTVVMDAYYDVHYAPIRNHHAWSRSYSTKIQEVSRPGDKDEKILAADEGTGFMWRLNTYWQYLERDGGLYIQCEAMSLSRDIPAGLGWMIGPFVETVPRESLLFTLGRTREQLLKKTN
ncbi:MAG TPA: hypothetical protein VEI01_04235 [Terriglobales bacterium]|nr:hypothetical protein [Terriglobales bacterium]